LKIIDLAFRIVSLMNSELKKEWGNQYRSQPSSYTYFEKMFYQFKTIPEKKHISTGASSVLPASNHFLDSPRRKSLQ
jgi:hypothetical protein